MSQQKEQTFEEQNKTFSMNNRSGSKNHNSNNINKNTIKNGIEKAENKITNNNPKNVNTSSNNNQNNPSEERNIQKEEIIFKLILILFRQFNDKQTEIPSELEYDPFGLPNMGNTCYYNSVIQMMIHCSKLTTHWPKQSNSLQLKKLNSLEESSSNEKAVYQKNKKLFSMITYSNKEVSHQQGNDPVRVISSIIQNSESKDNKINIKYPPNRLQKDYKYWVEDNSQLQFLFSIVVIAGIWCKTCSKLELIDEQLNYMIQVPKFKACQTIQDTLTNVLESMSTVPTNYEFQIAQQCSECQNKRQKISGFLKLPKFLMINLDEKIDVKQMKIDDEIKLFDQAREKDVEYHLKGFISHPPFHYTYFKREKGTQKWTHCNDNYISKSYTPPNQSMAKILLYCAKKSSRDPNIECNKDNFQLQLKKAEIASISNQNCKIEALSNQNISATTANSISQNNQTTKQQQANTDFKDHFLNQQKMQQNNLETTSILTSYGEKQQQIITENEKNKNKKKLYFCQICLTYEEYPCGQNYENEYYEDKKSFSEEESDIISDNEESNIKMPDHSIKKKNFQQYSNDTMSLEELRRIKEEEFKCSRISDEGDVFKNKNVEGLIIKNRIRGKDSQNIRSFFLEKQNENDSTASEKLSQSSPLS